MEKIILICDECECEIENNTYAAVYNLNNVAITEFVSATRTEQYTIDTFTKLHFCSKDCIEQFFLNTPDTEKNYDWFGWGNPAEHLLECIEKGIID